MQSTSGWSKFVPPCGGQAPLLPRCEWQWDGQTTHNWVWHGDYASKKLHCFVQMPRYSERSLVIQPSQEWQAASSFTLPMLSVRRSYHPCDSVSQCDSLDPNGGLISLSCPAKCSRNLLVHSPLTLRWYVQCKVYTDVRSTVRDAKNYVNTTLSISNITSGKFDFHSTPKISLYILWPKISPQFHSSRMKWASIFPWDTMSGNPSSGNILCITTRC